MLATTMLRQPAREGNRRGQRGFVDRFPPLRGTEREEEMRKVAFAAVLLVGLALAQEVPRGARNGSAPSGLRGRPQFLVGVTRDQLYRTVGAPRSCFIPQAQQYYPLSQCVRMRTIWGRVLDVYTLKTRTSEYEVTVAYEIDDSQSRLHPKVLVSEVRFTPDKHLPASTVLKDLDEVSNLCREGCTVVRETNDPYALAVCPSERSQPRLLKQQGGIPVLALHFGDQKLRTADSEPDFIDFWIPRDAELHTCQGEEVGAWPPKE